MRILVVDDSPVARIALRGMLESAGFTVVEAGDGNEGLRTFRRVSADVVLCDLFMPGCDGMEVIRELRREFPAARLIAMSGGGFDGKVDLLPASLRLGADAILYKPINQAALVTAVNQVLQKPVWESALARAGT